MRRTSPRLRRFARAPRPDRAILPFQDDLDALLAEPTPTLLRWWPALGAVLLAALVTIAAVAKVDSWRIWARAAVVVSASTPDARA